MTTVQRDDGSTYSLRLGAPCRSFHELKSANKLESGEYVTALWIGTKYVTYATFSPSSGDGVVYRAATLADLEWMREMFGRRTADRASFVLRRSMGSSIALVLSSDQNAAIDKLLAMLHSLTLFAMAWCKMLVEERRAKGLPVPFLTDQKDTQSTALARSH